MEFPRLEITRQDAQIEITSHRARVEITSRRSRFRMQRNHAQFRLDRRLPTLRVDRSQLFTALGIGPVLQSARQYFADSMQQGLEGIATIAGEGDMLMRIENGGNAIADLGVQAMESSAVEINTTALPQAEISWEPGYFNINWTPASMALEWDTSTWADILVEPHYVEIRMKQYPDVKIKVFYDTKQKKTDGKLVDKYL